MTYLHAPLSRFVLLLADGWRLPFVVEPTRGNHGNYSVTLWRPDDA